ncbi:zinc finger protein ZFPM1 [Marmota marmota marmota]|uniref:zinc finger protein ZFPM1 n=1 Tax=Marmota marmota marmota TaxID=9994 RepID=UPI002091F187|nr:zinc finger protein ZFPM1 [Marmota marmota marmota]
MVGSSAGLWPGVGLAVSPSMSYVFREGASLGKGAQGPALPPPRLAHACRWLVGPPGFWASPPLGPAGRSLGDMEAREEEAQAMESSLTEQEATAAELQAAGGPRPPSPPSTDTNPPSEPATPTSPGGPEEMEEQEPEARSQEAAAAAASPWSGPASIACCGPRWPPGTPAVLPPVLEETPRGMEKEYLRAPGAPSPGCRLVDVTALSTSLPSHVGIGCPLAQSEPSGGRPDAQAVGMAGTDLAAIQALPFTGCVTLGLLLDHPGPWFPKGPSTQLQLLLPAVALSPSSGHTAVGHRMWATGPSAAKPLTAHNTQPHSLATPGTVEPVSWSPSGSSWLTEPIHPCSPQGPALTLLLVDEACWLRTLPQAPTEAEANAEIHRKDDTLWCRVTKPVPAGELLHVFLVAEPCGHPVKKEPAEPECPAPVPTDIQLLPQQAGMASILASAVINKDVFPCKDCGIWYRSERNLQAHLLYYCASRQSAGSPATAATEEKPKESYPNERVCPFPQCRKSCPSASSLEIHMRSHSGERPFVCLICLSAFTTKANCERHLKVHTDTLSGVCHSCGFISTTRDILYSHLVTNHMVCQPGSKGEIYSPGAGHPAAKLPPDGLASIQQHSAPHGPGASGDLGLAPAPSPGQDRKVLVEATNGEARVAPQNGDGSETPAAPRSIKVEAVEEPEAARAPGPGEPGAQALSRTPSPHSPAAARVKAELSSPTPGSSPGPGELGLAGALFLPHYVFGPDAGAPSAPRSPSPPAPNADPADLGTTTPSKGPPAPAASSHRYCRLCNIRFSSLSTFIAHKKYYCSSHAAEHVK